MLEITIPKGKRFNEKTERFIQINEDIDLKLEHSLLSVKKWESKWHKPFLEENDKSLEEIYDYIRCMTIGAPLKKEIYMCIPEESMDKILEYIEDKMTATWFKKEKDGTNAVGGIGVITNEIIYYWMIKLGIPIRCQEWHLNQLLTLIRVVSIKEQPKKEMSRKEEAQQRSYLNKMRRAKYKSKG